MFGRAALGESSLYCSCVSKSLENPVVVRCAPSSLNLPHSDQHFAEMIRSWWQLRELAVPMRSYNGAMTL
ncbi:MAG: hypothetical protein CMJ77_11330 [Planctomycetaceae bacterium]|nr:hypothetical protein [Planctomycetaceae bacterium]